ncbi:hypothetical protein [Clostridium transplantifaecale]|uniref:hypothetical protein n=1 Tax=Clostridium transplantifaecale TaxID=2479838 RepID=UPI000F6341F1|nr:hypothetical protein [Clostridium transplantifaecale]
MKQEASLFIPIKVRAALVGKMPEKSIYSDFSYTFARLGDPTAVIEKPLFSEDRGRAPGVYLHWSLPDCFTQGIQDDNTKEISYRLAPNRWAVIRMWNFYDSKPADLLVHGRAFLVESDVLSKNASGPSSHSPSWPFQEDPKRPFRFLGRSFSMEESPDEGDGHIRLTAISPVSPFFAAYAPGCGNVFSFYDDLAAEQLSHVDLCYLICGWYQEDGEEEPFKSIKDWEQLWRDFGLTGSSPDFPCRTLCHGLLDQIRWETKDTLYHSGIPDDPEPGEIAELPVIAAGNNSAEALAALMNGNRSWEEERLTTILLHNLEQDLDRRQGLLKAEEELHHTKFGVEHTLGVTGMRKPPADEGEEPPRPPSREILHSLSLLRQRQRRARQNYAALLQKQRTIYENWYLHLYADEPYASMYSRATALSIQETALGLNSLTNEMEEIKLELGRLEAECGYELFEEKDEPFYVPTEPSLVISEKVPFGTRLKGPEESPLFCRTSGQEVTVLQLSHTAGITVSLPGSSLVPCLSLSSLVPEELRGEILSLVSEAVLLSSGFSGLLAGLAFQKAEKSPSEEDLLFLRSMIESAQNCGLQSSPIFTGSLPDPVSLNRYHAGWYPLILEWQANYYPDLKLLNPKPDFSRWNLVDGDYLYSCTETPDPVITPENAYPVQGRLFISDHAQMQLTALFNRRFQNNGMLRMKLLDALRGESRLSQALDGFNSFLMMREHVLPPALLLNNQSEQGFLDVLTTLDSSVIGDRPVFDMLFSPIRAGFLSLSRLRIIDALGRFQDIDYPDLYAAESLMAPKAVNPVHHLMLPPRLLQPSRLAAWFLKAGEQAPLEASFMELDSPVCGFVLPNLLDHSLVVYHPDGRSAGSLNLVETGAGIRWESPPGAPHSTRLPEDLDQDMYDFLEGLRAAGPKSLQNLVEYINRLQSFTQSGSHSPSKIEFVGKPVAVARLSVQLELFGEPESYRHYMGGDDPDRTSQTNVCAAGFSMLVGNLKNPADGTVGYFEDGDYRHFHICPEFTAFGADPYLIPGSQVFLYPDPKLPPKILTLLFDPWADISLITGILPVRTMSISKDLTALALQSIEVTCFCSPILTGSRQISVPVPHSDSLNFYWEAKNRTGDWRTELILCEDGQEHDTDDMIYAADGYLRICGKEREEETDADS